MCWIQRAKVGDKVICVDGAWSSEQLKAAAVQGMTLPKQGGVYTLRTIGEVIPGRIHVRLVEMVNPIIDYPVRGRMEQAFDHVMFRPVQSGNTDISIFTDMLKTADQPIREDA